MHLDRTRIVRLTRVFVLSLGALIAHQATASAQFGYGGMGYGGMGYGGMGYGYGGMGYGGIGYGGGGYGYGGYGYGYPGTYGYNAGYLSELTDFGTGNAGVGYPGISWRNPYFSFGLSPLAVENAVFERTVLGRTTPPLQSSLRATPPRAIPRPVAASEPVGTGTFSQP